MTVALRLYQQTALDGVRGAYRGGSRAVLLVLPTGGGKTICFAAVIAGASGRGRRCLVLAHRKELIRQASDKLHAAGVPHGIIAPGHTPTRDLVQVASVQTLGRRLDDPRYPAPELIVVDEAHHSVAGQWAMVLAAFPAAKILGVTATPERLDGRGLGTSSGGPYDAMVEGPTVADLTAEGFLSPARVFAPADGPDLSGVRTRGGDYEAAALAGAMATARIVGDAVEHYGRLTPGQPAILFSPSVDHAETMASAFRAGGVPSVAASGTTPPAERDAAIRGLENGAVHVLCSCDLISEGLDVPAVGCIILMRPTKSLGLYLQQVGRGLRPAPGKVHLTVLDHAGNTLRHGLIADARHWSLDGRKKRSAAPSTRQCRECFAVHAGPICPECGAGRAAEGSAGRALEEVAGTLEEVGAAPLTMDAVRARRLRTAPLSELIREAAGQHAALKEIAGARGYRKGWIWHQQQAWHASRASKPIPLAGIMPPPADPVDAWLRGAA